ncbi:hypothetical protein BCR34DRAFT_650422 [Clohesyomyces aquaticus]|uniref:Bacteriophage T5 Orf172 DNA-binding domain-containing protein n=1 Tax=Clohesyomyces aquaticus TaxID=1231657 RepID=A0A1Y1XZG1_9PLEO|nr:hypothetical protein BCR34DRAFT_650422 [Clohesyomyces aquaticus]
MAVLPLPMSPDDRAVASNAPNNLQARPTAQAGPLVVLNPSMTEKKAVAVVHVLPSPGALSGPVISPDVDPALYWPKAYDSSPSNIIAHANHHASPTHPHKLICGEISRLLDARDLRDGYVYAYEVEGSEGYVKICGATEAAAAPAVLVPHTRRVEALCHTEFDHRLIRMYCRACLKQHVEWFEVSVIEVTAVIHVGNSP